MMNGTVAALKGFTNKCGMALSNGTIGAVLALTGYVANAIGQEPASAIRGITFIRFGVPALMAVLILIAIVFYPITEEMKERFHAEAEKCAESAAGEAHASV